MLAGITAARPRDPHSPSRDRCCSTLHHRQAHSQAPQREHRTAHRSQPNQRGQPGPPTPSSSA